MTVVAHSVHLTFQNISMPVKKKTKYTVRNTYLFCLALYFIF